MLLLGCYLDVYQVGNASKDLKPPSLSRRTVPEMAFYELNYVLGFKANMAQKVLPSHEILSQRSEVVSGSDRAQLPSQGTTHTISVTTELWKKPFTGIWGRDTDTELMVSIYLRFSTL